MAWNINVVVSFQDTITFDQWENILSVNEKLLSKFRYFENYKRNLDSYFTFCVSGQLKTRLEQ